ncbi:MAG: DUF1273 family protein [Clostridia bacterium]|nr:DUF1273 family protein [Clostridia bacterium]
MEYVDLQLVPQFTKKVVCCFTGNRPHKLPWGEFETDLRCVAVKQKLREQIEKLINDGIFLFVCGMAQGADIYFAEILFELKEKYPHILIEGAIPYFDQAKSWDEKWRARYENAMSKIDYKTVICDQPSRYAPLKRNRYMVDKSSALISLNYDKSGGSAYTERYATGKVIKIIKIIE